MQSKMEEWLEAGVRLAFLIDPVDCRAWVYRPDAPPDEAADFEGSLVGENVLPGFSLPLSIFRP